MDKKWYNLFVSTDQPVAESGAEESTSTAPRPQAKSAASPAQTVADIAATIALEPRFAAPVSNPTSFEEIYSAAEITPPPHGYTILKVAEMLQSEHIRSLAPSVKRSSILVALEAAGVKVQEVIEDAVRRDRALDTYERVQEKALLELENKKNQENRQVQAELDKMVADYQARMRKNSDEVAKEKERFFGWRLKKQQEEQKVADAVSYFVTENPITTSKTSAPTPPAPSKPQGA
jgi:Asp-tRNA(Asn)/Glu-tRNA(Gln) amidotransferase A subunit family amidase